ncbi:hypothetical protein BASA81_008647 [Batrachochytrium salamandrivorans]|nr:hypothetical protein BASA81_008647 [Batrachochytrium salamandrivorans]
MQELFCSHDTLRMASQAGPPTSVSYDNCHEAIHVGWTNGEVSTYRPSLLNDNLINWSAFPAHRTAVLQTFGGCELGLFSLSAEAIKIHTSGGMQLYSKRANTLESGGSGNLFTCMAAYLPERVLLGTKSQGLVDLDVRSSLGTRLVGVCPHTTKLRAAPFHPRIVFSGSLDGSVAMIDTRTGKTSARGDFQATTGGRVSELDVNGSSLMVCAGYNNKNSLEAYVRVFDLRMNNRQLNPVHFAQPIGVQFLQDGSYSNILATSSAGVLRVVDVSTSTNLQFGNVVTNGGKVQAMSTSYTGLSFSVVDTDNFIHFWETCPQYRDVCGDLFMEEEHPAVPHYSSYDRRQTSLASFYSTDACAGYPLMGQAPLLSSSFPDKLLQTGIKPSPKSTLKIKPELLQRVIVRDQIGVVPNDTGRSGLSLLFDKHQQVYVHVDPRKTSFVSPTIAATTATSSAAAAARKTVTQTKPKISPGGEFDYSCINQTQFAGLEPLDFDPTSSKFTSALLHVLYFIPEFRNLCVRIDTCQQTGIPAELGLLFRMLDTARTVPSKSKCCQARNFIVAMRLSPDAAAMGLNSSLPPVTLSLVHFILAQFVKSDKDTRSGVEAMFASTFATPGNSSSRMVIDVEPAAASATLESAIPTAVALAPYVIFNLAECKPPFPSEFLCDRFVLGGDTYELFACVSLLPGSRTIAHLRVGEAYAQQQQQQTNGEACGKPVAAQSWLVFDDARVAESTIAEALDFSISRLPLLLVFKRLGSAVEPELLPSRSIDPEVFACAPLSQKLAAVSSLPTRALEIQPGAVVAIDCEFVALTHDVVEVNADGSKVVVSPRQLALARVSVVDSNFNVLIDDLVQPTMPVVDYLTRFSGLVGGDLDLASAHPANLFPFRIVYAKLVRLMEMGCVFVGHGLDSDFKVINMLLPPQQIRDTVHLFWLKGKRKLGLRFLSSVLLQHSIQDRGSRGHDSIEDAGAALRLYFKYKELESQNKLEETLARVYLEGPVRNWS